MNPVHVLFLYANVAAATVCFAQHTAVEQAGQLELGGKFKQAAATLVNALAGAALPAEQRKQLEFELDRLERIRKDYPLTPAALFAALNKSVKGLTADEFERWIAEGRFDSREIDGERRFMGSSVSNLFFRHAELNARRILPLETAVHDRAIWENCRAIKRAAQTAGKPYVLPNHFRVTMTVTAKAGAAPPGEIIRAWLPVPRAYPFQTDFELLKTSSPIKHLEPDTSAIRSVHLEQAARKDKPTIFKVEYAYTTYGVWFDLIPGTVRDKVIGTPLTLSLSPSDGERVASRRVMGSFDDPTNFTNEAPHVVFTSEMRQLSDEITGTESSPVLKAKKFYDWIAENIKYSYAIEYSTIRNIGEYCRSHGYGDCGQEALLFITLCRLNGIPARWQSGWNTFPGAKTIHDWCEIHLAPHGWVPVDPYMGIWAMRYATTLAPDQKREVRDFYFGGLDQYRMAANSDHNQELSPPKNSMRSDDVDFQRGELEWGGRNIYFDQYSYALQVREVKAR